MFKWYLKELKKFYQQSLFNIFLSVGMGLIFVLSMISGVLGIKKHLDKKKKPKIRLID